MKRVIEVVICLGFAFSVAYAQRIVKPVIEPLKSIGPLLPTLGSETGTMDSKIPPEACSTHVVESGIDYGSDFSCPINYPNARHIAQSLAFLDVPHVVWETGASHDNHVRGKYWDDFGLNWTDAVDISQEIPGTPIEAGRIGLASDTLGNVHAAWHQNVSDPVGTYEIFYAKWSWITGTWSTPVQISSTDPTEAGFPSITVDPQQNPWVVYNRGGTQAETDVFANHSTDGGDNWSEDNIENVTNNGGGIMYGSWILPVIDAAPNGDIHVAVGYDLTGDNWLDIGHIRRDAVGDTWCEKEIVAEAIPNTHPLFVPTIAVDPAGVCHLVFQENITDQDGGTGFSGWGGCGGAGQLYYTHNKDGEWLRDPVPIPEKYPGGEMGAAASGLPNIGIDKDSYIYVAFTEPPFAFETEEGVSAFYAFNAYCIIGTLDEDYNVTWTPRDMISSLPMGQTVNAMYPQITQDVPESGPGIIWAEMDAAALPASVLYHHLDPGLPPECDVATDEVISPPHDLDEGVEYVVAVKTSVLKPGYRGNKSYDVHCLFTSGETVPTDTVGYLIFNVIGIDSGCSSIDSFWIFTPSASGANCYFFTFWVEAASDINYSNDTLHWTACIDYGVEESRHYSSFSILPITNPLKSGSYIEFMLPQEDNVCASIYDIGGRLVKRLANGKFKQGTHRICLKENMPSGVYFFKLSTSKSNSVTRKLVVLE